MKIILQLRTLPTTVIERILLPDCSVFCRKKSKITGFWNCAIFKQINIKIVDFPFSAFDQSVTIEKVPIESD